jgi:hypothetical protein
MITTKYTSQEALLIEHASYLSLSAISAVILKPLRHATQLQWLVQHAWSTYFVTVQATMCCVNNKPGVIV